MRPWEVALAVTLAVEVPLVTLLFPGQRVKMFAVALAANAATNLTLNLVLARMPALAGQHVLIGELAAVVVEAGAYALASRPHDLPMSTLASGLGNALSYAVGFTGLPRWLLR